MLITEYYLRVETLVSDCPAIISRELSFEERTHHIGLIKGILTFNDGSELHVKEFLDVGESVIKYKYAYHYQRGNTLVFRYDNHPITLRNIPEHHKHHLSEQNIHACGVPDLESVLNEVLSLLPA